MTVETHFQLLLLNFQLVETFSFLYDVFRILPILVVIKSQKSEVTVQHFSTPQLFKWETELNMKYSIAEL